MVRGTAITVGLAVALLAGAVRGQEPPTLQLPLPPVPGFEGKEPPKGPVPVPPAAPGGEPRTVLQPPREVDPLERPVPFPKMDPAVILPDGSSVTLPETTRQVIRFAPRYGRLNDYVIDPVGDDVQRLTYSGGLIINVVFLPDRPGDPPREVEFATDNAVVWVKGAKRGTDIIGGLRTERAGPNRKADGKVSIEVYLSGNVVIRSMGGAPGGVGAVGATEQTLRAEEVYYDLDKSKAIALCADLETRFANGLDPAHVRAREIWRLGQKEYKAFDTLVFSSKRPADPALTIRTREATLTDETVVRRNIFGRPFRDARTGEVDASPERILTAEGNRVELLGVPIGGSRRYRAPVDDPVGPLLGLGVRNDNVFGFQVYSTFDVYKLLALRGQPGTRWILNADYLSLRGPGLGTEFTYTDLFGTRYPSRGELVAYGLKDKGEDVLGGFRGPEPGHPRYRARFDWNHQQQIYENGATYAKFMGQLAYQSDKNFYEQFYKIAFDQDPNRETFAYFYGASGNAAASLLGQVNVNRPWMTETQWLPRLDGALVGQSLFDRFVYTGRATAGFAAFRPATQEPYSTLPSESGPTDTVRVGANQRLSLPFDLGPFRVEPYGVADTTYYSQDVDRDSVGRLYGAGGVKASIPFSRLYADLASEAFNLRGIYHKVDYGVNAFVAASNTRVDRLPLLDRLQDDANDLTARTFRQTTPFFVAGDAAAALNGSPLYDPQRLALRRTVDTKLETLDALQVVQAEVRNRWQTKRGLPGRDHTVDYVGLDLSASYFPNADRDNFGSNVAFLEYNGFWNIGDRTAITSSGWYDPIETGARYFNANLLFNRPDGTQFSVGYRQTDPLGSKALTAILGYQLSPKYGLAIASIYDFGSNQAQSTSFIFSRTGTDLTVSVGFTYNAFINNFGIQFLVLPNAAAPRLGRPYNGMYQ